MRQTSAARVGAFIARVALAGWLAAVLAITLSPHNTATQARGDHVVATARRHVALRAPVSEPSRTSETDIVGNVLLFVPFGVLGAVCFARRRGVVVGAGFALSGAIELIQLAFLPHRSASVTDVALNSLGCALD